MNSIIFIEARFICKMKMIGKGKWKMTMGNKNVGELLAFICGVDKK